MADVDPLPPPVLADARTSTHTRLIEVLDALVRRNRAEPWGVRELASELGESRSTVNRILLALVERELAVEVGTGKYQLGPRLCVLTHSLIGSGSWLASSAGALGQLAETSNATALISISCPRSQGYFVAACEQPKSSLMFRPEFGVMYPLSFGDLGRAFKKYCAEHRDTAIEEPLLDKSVYLSEVEFPQPFSVSTTVLGNGLLIAVSLHSVHGRTATSTEKLDREVNELTDTLAKQVAASLRAPNPRYSCKVIEDHKSTTTRLERLLLLACSSPDGLPITSDLNDQLLCNMATGKRLMESGAYTEIVNSVEGTLFPGPKLYQWATKIGHCENIVCLARSTVQDLVQETGETIAILSYDANTKRAEFVEVIQGWRPIQYQLAVRTEVPLYAGAAGKAVLAYCDAETVKCIDLVKLTDTTITSRPALADELKRIHERGWATGSGERVPGAFGLAVPFFVDGVIKGSISATIPQYRKDDRDLPGLTQRMLEASAKIGRLLSLGLNARER